MNDPYEYLVDSHNNVATEGLCTNDECREFEQPQDVKATVHYWSSGGATMDYECQACHHTVEGDEYDTTPDYDLMNKQVREQALQEGQ